jgi:hypothetical protein
MTTIQRAIREGDDTNVARNFFLYNSADKDPSHDGCLLTYAIYHNATISVHFILDQNVRYRFDQLLSSGDVWITNLAVHHLTNLSAFERVVEKYKSIFPINSCINQDRIPSWKFSYECHIPSYVPLLFAAAYLMKFEFFDSLINKFNANPLVRWNGMSLLAFFKKEIYDKESVIRKRDRTHFDRMKIEKCLKMIEKIRDAMKATARRRHISYEEEPLDFSSHNEHPCLLDLTSTYSFVVHNLHEIAVPVSLQKDASSHRWFSAYVGFIRNGKRGKQPYVWRSYIQLYMDDKTKEIFLHPDFLFEHHFVPGENDVDFDDYSREKVPSPKDLPYHGMEFGALLDYFQKVGDIDHFYKHVIDSVDFQNLPLMIDQLSKTSVPCLSLTTKRIRSIGGQNDTDPKRQRD